MIVVDIPMANGLPVIATAALIKKEGDSGWYSAHFAPVDKLWVMLFSNSPGSFLAIPNTPSLVSRLPNGVAWQAFLRSPAGRKWRHWAVDGTDADGVVTGRRVVATEDVSAADASEAKPWTMGGVTVTRAMPTLPSVCGQPKGFLEAQIQITRGAQP